MKGCQLFREKEVMLATGFRIRIRWIRYFLQDPGRGRKKGRGVWERGLVFGILGYTWSNNSKYVRHGSKRPVNVPKAS